MFVVDKEVGFLGRSLQVVGKNSIFIYGLAFVPLCTRPLLTWNYTTLTHQIRCLAAHSAPFWGLWDIRAQQGQNLTSVLILKIPSRTNFPISVDGASILPAAAAKNHPFSFSLSTSENLVGLT